MLSPHKKHILRPFCCCFLAHISKGRESCSTKPHVLSHLPHLHRMVECIHCGQEVHKICVLHHDLIWPDGYQCDECLKAKGMVRKENQFTAEREWIPLDTIVCPLVLGIETTSPLPFSAIHPSPSLSPPLPLPPLPPQPIGPPSLPRSPHNEAFRFP